MLLSIAMMVKNEEKHLEECLASLQPIMDKISSELIIVDTGSTDNTVNIAKKFTDKVYFHKWNDNFSEMRNITIGYSKGEWLYIIDGDEVIKSSQAIIDFFCDGAYKNYNSATVEIRSLQRENGSECANIVSPRLFKNDGEFYYSGAVHNQPHYKGPLAKLNVDIIHYGYISDDDELMERKFNRTATLLMKELEKDPENIYYRYQLSVSYDMRKYFKEALVEAEKSYNSLKKSDNDLKVYLFVYNNYIKQLLKNEKYDLGEEIIKEALELEDRNLDLFMYMGKVKFIKGFYSEAKEYYLKYLKILNEDNLSDLNMTVILYTADMYEIAYRDLFTIYFNEKDYYNAINSLNNIDNKDFIVVNILNIVKAFLCANQIGKLKEYYLKYNLGDSEITYKAFICSLESNLIDFSPEVRSMGYELFLDEESNYSLLNKIRLEYSRGRSIITYIDEVLNRIDLNEAPDFWGDIIYYSIKESYYVDNIIMSISEKNLDMYLRFLKAYHKNFKDVFVNYIKNNKDSSITLNKLSKAVYRILLEDDSLEYDEHLEILKDYICFGISYIEKLYNTEVLEYEFLYEMKNDEEIFFLLMRKAIQYMENDKLAYIKALRKVLKFVPLMSKEINLLLNEINSEEAVEQNEFEKLKSELKSKIRECINNNDHISANELINQYEQIVPNDLELVLLKSELAVSKSKNINFN